tara:strand:+ start:2169 stop:2564 length:396 start_codon:yes stop_codon:yes gene_type:complete
MSKNYRGVIIEESLENKEILKKIKILDTEIEQVTEKHQTPWIKKWTLHTVEISKDEIDDIVKEISQVLDSEHDWYADFKDDAYHYIVFRNKVFKVNRISQEEYNKVKEYGISLGIPEYQVDFHPEVEEWER